MEEPHMETGSDFLHEMRRYPSAHRRMRALFDASLMFGVVMDDASSMNMLVNVRRSRHPNIGHRVRCDGHDCEQARGGEVSDAITEGEPTEEMIRTMRSSFASFSTPEQTRFPERSRNA